MYWSEELPAPKKKTPDLVSPTSGQRTYHGSHELIASNHMEVLDVLTFAGKADVLHWDEESDSLSSKLYWRQTMNRETSELSVCTLSYPQSSSLTRCAEPPETLHMRRPLQPRNCNANLRRPQLQSLATRRMPYRCHPHQNIQRLDWLQHRDQRHPAAR